MENSGLVLVTGGSGYIGSMLVPELLKNGYRVRVLDIGYFGHQKVDSAYGSLELVEEDIRDCKKEVFEGVNAVIHLAGFSNDPTAEYNPAQNFSVNFDGTRHIVRLAKECGVRRFIFGSTCSVYYTDQPDDVVRTESSIIYPRAPYSLSKYFAEKFLMSEKSSDFTPIILRKGTVYGLSPRMRYDLAINTLVKNAFMNKSIILHSGGWMWRPFVNIRDVAKAYKFFLEVPLVDRSGLIFNVVGFNTLISDLANAIQSIIRDSFSVEVVLKKEDSGPQRSYRVSGDKLKKLAFTMHGDLQKSVCDIWRKLESGEHDLGEAKYYNIRRFEQIFPREV